MAVAVFVADVFFTSGQTRIYQATATLLIDPDPPRPLGKDVQTVVDIGNGSYWNNKEYLETQNRILEGMSISRETARQLNLHRDPEFIANTPAGRKARPLVKPLELDDAAMILQSRLTVDPIRDSRLVRVHLIDANPDRARRILSSLVDTYIENNIDQVVQSTESASVWLRNQKDKLKSELEQSELALHEYKKEKQILSVSLDDQSNMLRGEMQLLNEELARTGTKLEQLKAQSAELDKIDSNDPSALPSTVLLSNNVLSNLRESYVQARSELNSLLGRGKGDSHPEVEAVRAKVENTRQALMNEVRNVQGAVRSDLYASTKEAKGIGGLFGRAKQRALDLNMLEIEYRRLERTKDNTEKLYGLVLERSKESELTGMLRFNNIRVTEPALVGKTPVKPRVPLNLAIGLVLGLVLGGGTALGRGYLDQTVHTPEELEAELGLPFLGVLPSLSDRSRSGGYYSRRHSRRGQGHSSSKMPDELSMELIAHALPSSHAAESVRVIRTSLTFSSPDKPYQRILVTSSSPSEGKTTVAVSIAIAFAQAGQRVLILDADLRRARMHRVFRTSNADGLSTALQSSEALERALIQTQVPNLTLLPGGPHMPNPAEILQSESFERLLKELAARFDRIVIDSPPVLAVTDAAILSARVDTTILVVRAGKSKLDTMRQAWRKLQEVSTPVAGVVLNALEPPRWGTRYYYYYSYYGKKQYGTYGDRNEA